MYDQVAVLRQLTSIELLAIGLKGAAVMDIDLVALASLAIALDGNGNVDAQLFSSQDANSGGGQQRQR